MGYNPLGAFFKVEGKQTLDSWIYAFPHFEDCKSSEEARYAAILDGWEPIEKSELPYKFSIISGEQPRFPKKTKEHIENHLKQAGYKYNKIKGKYGGQHETSYIVHNADPKHINELGHKHGQESVIHSEGGKHKMVYTSGEGRGKHHKGSGIKYHHSKPKDNYSSHNGKHFTLNFNFNKLHN